jgi:hypothetical protein
MAVFGIDDYVAQAAGQQLKHNQLLAAIMDEMQETALTAWIATAPDEVAKRESAHRTYMAALELQTMIDNAIAETAEVTDPQETKQ